MGHDLSALRTNCVAYDVGFNGVRIISHCAYLNAFATIRYPDFMFSVNGEDVKRGINSAKRIYYLS